MPKALNTTAQGCDFQPWEYEVVQIKNPERVQQRERIGTNVKLNAVGFILIEFFTLFFIANYRPLLHPLPLGPSDCHS